MQQIQRFFNWLRQKLKKLGLSLGACIKKHYPIIIVLLAEVVIIWFVTTIVSPDLLCRAFWKELNNTPSELSNVIRGLGLGIGAAIGLPFLIWQAFQRERTSKAQAQQALSLKKQIEVNEQGQITERFTKAIEQLGDGKLTIRLGGIYALERISKESEKDYWPIMDILADFVREKTAKVDLMEYERLYNELVAATLKSETAELENKINEWVSNNKNSADVLAAMKVMGRGKQKLRPKENQHDVKGLDLRGIKIVGLDLTKLDYSNAVANEIGFIQAKLIGANLERVYLERGYLVGANLLNANLINANFLGANLKVAILDQANLKNAYLLNASLERANLREANLEGANLYGANLSGANLFKADLANANLHDANLREAILLEVNFLGANLTGTDLSRTDLTMANLYKLNLFSANLSESNLEKTELAESMLLGANLAKTKLAGANLANAEFAGANLIGAKLEDASVEHSDWFENLAQLKKPPLGLEKLQQKYWINPDKPLMGRLGNTYYKIEQRPQSNESQ